MKIERTKNARRNIFFGSILKLYQILVPFVMRTLIMYELGAKYLGLNSLFTSVLQVLNLAELGVGSAMVFSMYKPIAEDRSDTICALMKLYKIYYRAIGLFIFIVGIVLTPFVPKLIKGDIPSDINIYILYLINLIATVLTYWIFAYRNSILQAHQRVDVSSRVTLITDTVKYGIQFIAISCFHNYYIFVMAILVSQLINNLLIALFSKKLYPNYTPSGKLNKKDVKSINGRIRDLFTSKLGGTIVNSADSIIISAFLGLEVLALYQNYFYVVSSVIGFMTIIYSSITAGVGNSMLVKTIDENREDFYVFSFLMAWISCFCISEFLSLFQPFMRIWMGENALLSIYIVILLCVYFWVFELVMLISVYKDAAGIWHQDRFRPLLSGLVNLALNLLMVKFLGLYGIILSTVFSIIFVSLPWIVHNVFCVIFNTSPRNYVKCLFKYSMGIALIAGVSYFVSNKCMISGFCGLIVKGVIAMLIANIGFVLLFSRSAQFSRAKDLLKRIIVGWKKV